MRIIAFNGSPRPGGNAEVLLLEALKPLREAGHDVRLFTLNTMHFKPCQDCGGCTTTGLCIHSDDMSKIYDAIREAERIILASPIFFYSLSAQTKTMVDRCQSFWCEKYLLKKSISAGPQGRKGLLLLVGGMKKDDGRQSAESVAKAFFRTVSVPEHETLFFGGVDAKGDVGKHPTALKEAYEAGKRLGK
ncbi:MAG TPA: flavodoxin family protein [Nitrospirota bacterium]|nr:flavodoxin family protein [Nitrospirota bacterium]